MIGYERGSKRNTRRRHLVSPDRFYVTDTPEVKTLESLFGDEYKYIDYLISIEY